MISPIYARPASEQNLVCQVTFSGVRHVPPRCCGNFGDLRKWLVPSVLLITARGKCSRISDTVRLGPEFVPFTSSRPELAVNAPYRSRNACAVHPGRAAHPAADATNAPLRRRAARKESACSQRQGPFRMACVRYSRKLSTIRLARTLAFPFCPNR